MAAVLSSCPQQLHIAAVLRSCLITDSLITGCLISYFIKLSSSVSFLFRSTQVMGEVQYLHHFVYKFKLNTCSSFSSCKRIGLKGRLGLLDACALASSAVHTRCCSWLKRVRFRSRVGLYKDLHGLR